MSPPKETSRPITAFHLSRPMVLLLLSFLSFLHTCTSLPSPAVARQAYPIFHQVVLSSNSSTNLTAPNAQMAGEINWETTPFLPTSIPLAVRSPYLSVWLEAGRNSRRGVLNSQYAAAFNGNFQPWCIGARVDEKAYTAMSNNGYQDCLDGELAIQMSMSFTATKSEFVMRAGPVDLTISFLSPITPDDLTRQSLPYSYLTITAESNDGEGHDVQLYTDISAKLVGNDWDAKVNWTTETSGSMVFHQIQRQEPVAFGEIDDFTLAGSLVYASSSNPSTTYATGPGPALRQTFQSTGALNNTQDTNYRSISDDSPAFAFAHTPVFSDTTVTSDPFILVIGHYRSPAFSWTATNDSSSERVLYFEKDYPGLLNSLTFFWQDYQTARPLSATFDAEVQADALNISENYPALVALAARQVYAGMEISVGQNDSDPEDVMTFTKEIATSNYISTVDIVYPAFPFFVYHSPAVLRSLIEPILRYTASGNYPNPWCVHDLGESYPNVTGRNDGKDEWMFIEETAAMLIMSDAYLQATNDTSQATKYYSVLKGWTDYLAGGEALHPQAQVSSDDFQGPLTNSTNLAVKGITAIAAMADISMRLGESADASNYRALAENWAEQFLGMAMSADGSHIKLTYHDADDTWAIIYHLFPDRLLGLKLWPSWLYDKQAAWYASKATQYGVPLDSRNDWAKSDWQLQAAAAHLGNNVTNTFIDGVYNYLEQGETQKPFPDAYVLPTQPLMFIDRPVVGSIFSPLALDKLEKARSQV